MKRRTPRLRIINENNSIGETVREIDPQLPRCISPFCCKVAVGSNSVFFYYVRTSASNFITIQQGRADFITINLEPISTFLETSMMGPWSRTELRAHEFHGYWELAAELTTTSGTETSSCSEPAFWGQNRTKTSNAKHGNGLHMQHNLHNIRLSFWVSPLFLANYFCNDRYSSVLKQGLQTKLPTSFHRLSLVSSCFQ